MPASERYVMRWLLFGTQSAGDSRFVGTMFTAIGTYRQLRRDVFSFVTAAVQAHLAGQPAPVTALRDVNSYPTLCQ